jgi:hypothetical protein
MEVTTTNTINATPPTEIPAIAPMLSVVESLVVDPDGAEDGIRLGAKVGLDVGDRLITTGVCTSMVTPGRACCKLVVSAETAEGLAREVVILDALISFGGSTTLAV